MISEPSISPAWRAFLTRRLPLAIIALAVAVELLAYGVDAIPFRRHDLDLLALNVEIVGNPASPHRTIVIGDSVTQDIFKTYAIGAERDVANLTTNMANGMVGAYLLLRRYLRHHPAPRHLVIASTPEFFTYKPEGETARVYLATVFRRPEEVDFLAQYLAKSEPPYSPAILNMDERVGLKFVALLAPPPQGVFMGGRMPDPDLLPRSGELPTRVRDGIVARAKIALDIPHVNFEVLKKICALAEEFEFSIQIQMAPIPQTTFDLWTQANVLARFESSRDAFLETECPQAQVIHQGSPLVVPDEAMRDSDHLIRHDWTNAYALVLDSLIRALP